MAGQGPHCPRVLTPGESGPPSEKSTQPHSMESSAQRGCSAFSEHPALPPPESYFCRFLAWFLSLHPHLRPGLDLHRWKQRPQEAACRVGPGEEWKAPLWNSMGGSRGPMAR